MHRVEPGGRLHRQAGRAEAQREQLLLSRRPVGEVGLVVVPTVGDAHRPAGFQHDAVRLTQGQDLGDQRRAVVHHLGRGGAQRVRVDLAEGIAHGQVRIRPPEQAVMRQHGPGVHGQSGRGERATGSTERVRRRPLRRCRYEAPAGPGAANLGADRHVAGGVRGVDEATRRVQGTCRARRVIRGGDRHGVDPDRRNPVDRRRVVVEIPGVGVADGGHHRGVVAE